LSRKNSVVLIGMPGSGKSTLGHQLAEKTGLDFVDTDILIQQREGKSLQRILDESNYMNFLKIEESVLRSVDTKGCVVSTGGSSVYSRKGMDRLRSQAIVLFLDVCFKELVCRINNYDQRGIACKNNQSFYDVYLERKCLYQRYADIVIDCNEKSMDVIVDELRKKTLGNFKQSF
jgi:shikimate kinase